ncbi:MAG: DEAD/DEAH box helicase family protein [Cyclobacteriaceae bacterium]
MKFTLKDYQEEAVGDVLININKAAKRWHEDNDIHAFSLTATTGAGKTVMAAAVFEALFYGDDTYDFEADPTATVIWFSDDPSLNEQTRYRLMEAADKLDFSDLEVVDNTFAKEKLEPGKIYFLNTQKLSKSSLLVRGHRDTEEIDPDQQEIFPDSRPDSRAFTIWDIIQNTIEDSERTLYLVLDEAHRGMGKSSTSNGDKSTIVKRLINGAGSVPAIPIVWGISATVERFNKAIEAAEKRSTLPNVIVDSAKVQESGLLKDTIILDNPEGVGQFDTVLVRRGAQKIKESSEAWKNYADQQGEKNAVLPLMVLQVPNTPDPDSIGVALDTIFSEWPDINPSSAAHVFGEHKTLIFGGHAVKYVSPQRVQDETKIRILIAKDAISTGWDCPRAEVMVSFRPAKDKTHITQLLGRMVRTPLARRIPGNERLNSVDCLLPFFDAKSVEAVADALMTGGAEEEQSTIVGRKVLINPIETKPNPSIDEKVWECFEALPSQSLPRKEAKPIKRLTALAQEFAADNIIPDAGKKAHSELHKALDAASKRYSSEIDKARNQTLVVKGRSLVTDLADQSKSFNEFVEDADFTVIYDSFRRAARVMSPDLARTYAEYLAATKEGDDEELLTEAYTDIASMGLVPDIQKYLDSEADVLAKKWFAEKRVEIKGQSDERQEVYRDLKSWSKEPEIIDLVKPKSWMMATTILEKEVETPIKKHLHHMMCDEVDKMFPCDLNDWESEVLATESARNEFVTWYRNPARTSQDSLGIAYEEDKTFKIMRPDFIFFSTDDSENVIADIVDPHGTHLSDAMPKLLGLAAYAEEHAKYYRRIDAVAKVGEKFKVIDLKEKESRAAISQSTSAKSLFESSIAQDY